MTIADIVRLRLSNQQLSQQQFQKPQEIIAWFGAVQSQDFANAKWAIGQRLPNMTDESIEQAYTSGAILRTHIMRPTWHFVAPDDIRWLQALTAPRVKAVCAYYFRQLGLTEEIFQQSKVIITKALTGGKQYTRTELGNSLKEAGIITENLALAHLIINAELDALICSGPRRGKQFTYMLLEERVQQKKILSEDEALTELTKRYFTSHGPATKKDFSWWSGLTAMQVNKGIALYKKYLSVESVEGNEYWFKPSDKPISETVYLLPNYDEYIVSYKDRTAFYDANEVKKSGSRENVPFNNVILIQGRIAGVWKRTVKKDSVVIEPKFFYKPTENDYQALAASANQYAKFLKTNKASLVSS
jgi:hypothetical protein